MAKVWRDTKGKLFHDECFESGETRDGYKAVTLDELDDDDACESCGGMILAEVEEDDEDEDDDAEETA